MLGNIKVVDLSLSMTGAASEQYNVEEEFDHLGKIVNTVHGDNSKCNLVFNVAEERDAVWKVLSLKKKRGILDVVLSAPYKVGASWCRKLPRSSFSISGTNSICITINNALGNATSR